MWLPVMTLWAVQISNVVGEEARQVLNEIDFSISYLNTVAKVFPVILRYTGTEK